MAVALFIRDCAVGAEDDFKGALERATVCDLAVRFLAFGIVLTQFPAVLPGGVRPDTDSLGAVIFS